MLDSASLYVQPTTGRYLFVSDQYEEPAEGTQIVGVDGDIYIYPGGVLMIGIIGTNMGGSVNGPAVYHVIVGEGWSAKQPRRRPRPEDAG